MLINLEEFNLVMKPINDVEVKHDYEMFMLGVNSLLDRDYCPRYYKVKIPENWIKFFIK